MKLFYLGGSSVTCIEEIYARYLSTTKAYFSTLEAVDGVHRWGLCSSVDSDILYLKECFSVFIEACIKYDIIKEGFATDNLKFSDLDRQPTSISDAIDAYRDKILSNTFNDVAEPNVYAIISNSINDMADALISAKLDFSDMLEFMTVSCDSESHTIPIALVDEISNVEFSPLGYLTLSVSFVDSVTQDK